MQTMVIPFGSSFYLLDLSHAHLHPTAPLNTPESLTFPSIEPYIVTVTWDPHSDDGRTPDTLNYMVALTTTTNG